MTPPRSGRFPRPRDRLHGGARPAPRAGWSRCQGLPRSTRPVLRRAQLRRHWRAPQRQPGLAA